MKKTKYKAAEENGIVTLSGVYHVQSFPVRDLQKWISFYSQMETKYGRKTSTYARRVKVLRDLKDSMSLQA